MIQTIKQLLNHIDNNPFNPTALNDYINNRWRSYSNKEYVQLVKYLALGLYSLGLRKGDMIGIMSASCSKWMIADLACTSIGLVTVPLFANVSEENFLYEVQLTNVKTIFIGGSETWPCYEDHKDLFKTTIFLDEGYPGTNILLFKELIETGIKIDKEFPNLYEELCANVYPADLCTIIFTSGSTGLPKGAEHTHKSMTGILELNPFAWQKDDIYLSLLPLAHVFARTVNEIVIKFGVSCYFFNDLKNVGVVCRELHPTITCMVPRLLEKIYRKMQNNLEEASLPKRLLGKWAFKLALQEKNTLWKKLCYPLANKLVYSKLREAIGGKIRLIFSGGAALDPHIHHFFLQIGIPIYQGWGQTEACPGILNRPGYNKIGTIGQVVDYLKLKFSPENEILIKGDIVMRGYYKDPEATALAFDKEGWLHTGDVGSIDEEGYITLEGRIKDLMKSSTGEMIAPVPIEHAICKAPFIETAVVLAEHHKFASCLLVPDFEVLHRLKQEQNQTSLSDEEFLNSDYIQQEMNNLLQEVNDHLNHWEKIHAYRFIPHPLSIEKGEITPSLKIVRKVVEFRYKDFIDSMYEEAEKYQEVTK